MLKEELRYHAYVVPVQKGLCEFCRLATVRCYLTGASEEYVEMTNKRGSKSDILLDNVLENHIYEDMGS